MIYRSQALRDSANGESCVNCGTQDGTIVWAHGNFHEFGKGMGQKCSDLIGNYLCAKCHRLYDELLPRGLAREFFEKNYPYTMYRVSQKIADGKLKL